MRVNDWHNSHSELVTQAANITARWHAENCGTDMCGCMDDARALLSLAHWLAEEGD